MSVGHHELSSIASYVLNLILCLCNSVIILVHRLHHPNHRITFPVETFSKSCLKLLPCCNYLLSTHSVFMSSPSPALPSVLDFAFLFLFLPIFSLAPCQTCPAHSKSAS